MRVQEDNRMGLSQNKNMDEFLEEAHMHSQIRNERFVQGTLEVENYNQPNVIQPDDADEESVQGEIIEALAHKDENFKIDEEKVELENRSRIVSKRK